MLREVADRDVMPGLKFKLVERAELWSNGLYRKPTQQPWADVPVEIAKHAKGGGGPCRKSNVLYEFSCQQCPADRKAVYIGESARNLYTRGREHYQNYTRWEQELFMKKKNTYEAPRDGG